MKIGIPKETRRGERRVAAVPDTVKKLIQRGFTVAVEAGAGAEARLSDADFEAAGAEIVSTEAVWTDSALILKVALPTSKELKLVAPGTAIASIFDSDETAPVVQRMAAKELTFFALDAVPRITRAQSMDIRSSMANLAGYRAVIEAASRFGRTVGAQVTAAGSTRPAKVLVIGAGVAGLAAVAAARALGAEVEAFDTRAAAREQVESLGARFLEVEIEEDGEGQGGYAKVMSQAFIDAEMALFRERATTVDMVITTAMIPNRPAPKLWLEDMVEAMKPGSVIVDLAAPRGGNCECTEPGKVTEAHGVTIIGLTDLTQQMASHASQLLARNILALVQEFGGPEAWSVDLDNDVIRGVTVLEGGEVRWPAPPPEPSPIPAKQPEPDVPVVTAAAAVGADEAEGASPLWGVAVGVALVAFMVVAKDAPPEFLHHLKVFVLSCFIGWQVIWNVSPALHTPLMAVTNAISGIIIVGGMLQVGSGSLLAAMLGFLAIFFASINVFGGFAVTHRMLAMFRGEAA